MKQDSENKREVGWHESDTEPNPFTEKLCFGNRTEVLLVFLIKTEKTDCEADSMFTSLSVTVNVHDIPAHFLCL